MIKVMNNKKVRTFKIGGLNIQASVGSDKNITSKDYLKSKKETARILRGETITKKRVKFSNLGRILVIKKLAEKDGMCCNNPYCPNRAHTDEYINYYGLDGFQIDHKDNNPRNNCLSNLQILCSACNQMKGVHKVRI